MLLIPIGTLVVLVFAGFVVLDRGIASERLDALRVESGEPVAKAAREPAPA
jgi:hypothetical protein